MRPNKHGTVIYPVDSMAQVSLDELIATGKSGDRLISIPTDTVPALASRPVDAAMIYDAKQRSQTKPLILMGHHADDLWGYVQWDHQAFAVWQQMAFWYWPGALTLVLPASDRLPHAVNPTDPTTIGIRVPNCALARHILAHTGPLATTSINRSGTPPLETIADINEQFPTVLTLSQEEIEKWSGKDTAPPTQPSTVERSTSAWAAISNPQTDEHPSPPPLNTQQSAGTPSTVIKWHDNSWKVLRQGSVDLPSSLLG